MKKFQLGLLFIVLSIASKAQLTGTKTIPGDYATLAAALTDLNNVGVGTGGVTINLTQAETAPAGGYLIGSLVLNASTGPTKPVVINGGGNVITGFTGTQASSDAILRVAGTDYVTLNQINMVDAVANTTTTTQMERGIWACIFSQNDATQNLTISNCNINLNNTAGNFQEVGILLNADIYTNSGAAATYSAVFATLPTNVSGYSSNITIQGNTINNCYNGIMVRGNLITGTASVTAVMMANNVTIGGNSAALGNIISNIGSPTISTIGYGIFTINVNDQVINYNTISTSFPASAVTSVSSIQAISSGVGTGIKTINNNDISISNAVVNSNNAISGIVLSPVNTVGYPLNTDVNVNNNNLHDFNIAGVGTLVVLQVSANSSGVCNVRNNTITNITRSGITGTTFGIQNSANGTGTRSVSYNTISNINFPNTNLAANLIFNAMSISNSFSLVSSNPALSSQNGEVKGNILNNYSFTGTGSVTHNVYGIVCGFTYGTLSIDSNQISGFNVNVVNANIAAIQANNNATSVVNITRNKISAISKTVLSNLGGLSIDGIAATGTCGSRTLNNNMISNITCTGCHLDNAVKGLNINGAVNNQVYDNTIFLGSGGTLTSTGAAFGVSGISFSLGSTVDLRNNIINVKATPVGTGIVAAIRSADAGTAGTPSSNYATTSNNNVLFAINAANSFLYAEGVASGTITNAYNLTNDPNFNTGCSAFKAFAGGRETSSFTEDNLVAITPNKFAPSGNSFAESGGQVLASVTTDVDGVPTTNPPDIGAVNFSGTVSDAAPPSISFNAPYYSFLCVGLPTLTVNITDVTGVNTNPGTKPRLYYKKPTDLDAYNGNTSANNGWKYVEASNSSSPFTFTFDGSILQTPAVVNDVLQYFIVAQDNVATPNVAVSTAALTTCPSSVDLSASFPTLNTVPINTLLLANYGNTTLVPVANPTNACFNSFTNLTVSDTIIAPGIMPTGYYNPQGQISGTTLDDIRRFQIVSTTLNNSSTCTGTGGPAANGLPGSLLNRYSNYTALVTPPTLLSGTTYTVSFDVANCSTTSASSVGVVVFLDLNRNGIFDANEKFFNSVTTTIATPASNAIATGTFTMAIPTSGVVNGPTLMRVLCATGGASTTMTTGITYTSGEIEDYQVYLNSSQIKAVNTLPSSAFVWTGTPTPSISTNPNRSVTANNLQATTVFTVTATDAGGCVATATLNVNIATPILVTGVTGNTSYCGVSGANTTLTATTANGSTPFTATWTGGPVQSSSGLSATLNPTTTTTYTVNVTDACGTSASTTVTITVNPVPVLTFTPGSGPACSGTTSNQTASATGGSGFTYSWLPGNLVGNTQSLAPTVATTYTVTVTNSFTCSSTNTFTLTPSTSPTITSVTPVPTLACVGDSVQITTVATAGVTYSWLPTAGLSSATVQNPKAAPITPTIYTVTVTTAAGCTKTNNVLVNVHPLITGTKSVSPETICVGGSSTVNATVPSQCGGTVSGFQQSYAPASWTLSQTNSNGTVTTTGAPANIVLKSGKNGSGNPGSTNYSVTVGCSGTISFNWSYTTPDFAYNDYPKYKINNAAAIVFPTFDLGGASTQSGTFSVTVNAGDVFQLQAYTEDNDPFDCTITLTSFSGPAAPVTGTASIWSAKTGGINLGNPPQTFSPSSTTKYYIQYTQNGTGCVNPFRDSVQVTVNPLPTISVAAAPNDSICAGGNVTLTGSGASTYKWNGTQSLTSDTLMTPAVGGTFTVTGTDANGCTNTTTQVITIMALPNVTANASPNDTICLGSSVTLQGGGAATYKWNGITTLGSDTLLSPAVAGTYTVIGTDAFGCSKSATQQIWIQSVTVSANASPNDTVCTGNPVTLLGSGANTYTWNGVPTSTSDTTLTPAVAGIYTVTGTDALGCSNSATIQIALWVLPNVTANTSNSQPCPNASITLTGGYAQTYVWSGGAVNGVPFIPTAGIYTVTGTDVNGCTSATTITISPSSGSDLLSNATAGNASSTAGTGIGADYQVPNNFITYYAGSCNLILGITTANNLGQVTSATYVEDLSSTYPTYLGQPFVPRWFSVTPANDASATVTFYLTQDDFNDYNTYASANGWPLLPTGPGDAAGIANIRITKNPTLGVNPIVLTPLSVIWNATSMYWEIQVFTPGFSQFRIHAVNPVNAPLPVVISSFSGVKVDAGNAITWTTSSERNNHYFNLQYSGDGQHYATISKVMSKSNQGNSDVPLTYSFLHQQVNQGHNYYRLQQVDLDDKTSYHAEVIDLIWSSKNDVLGIYPNPASQVINVEIYTPKAQQVNVKVKDMSGRTVQELSILSTSGNNVTPLPIESLASGLYTIETMVNGQLLQVSKFSKQ